MFNFGLLSTHLPYLVFVAAYVFYFFTSSGNEPIVADGVQSSEKVVVQKGEFSQIEDSCKKIAYYDAFYASIGNSSPTLKTTIPKAFFRVLPDEAIYSCYISFALFSRPPPVQG